MLSLAVRYGHQELAEYLCQIGADVEVQATGKKWIYVTSSIFYSTI